MNPPSPSAATRPAPLGLSVRVRWGTQLLSAQWVPAGRGLWIDTGASRRQLVRSEGPFFIVEDDAGTHTVDGGQRLRAALGNLEATCSLEPRPSRVRRFLDPSVLEFLLAIPLIAAAFVIWGSPPRVCDVGEEPEAIPVSRIAPFQAPALQVAPSGPRVAPPR
jgi:hypothetical protein